MAANDYVGGGFGRAMSRGHKFGQEKEPPKESKPQEQHQEGHSRHATIRKHGPGHFTVEHEHGQSGPHRSFQEAAHHAGQAMGESVEEPENEDAPIENALGMVKDGMGGDD